MKIPFEKYSGTGNDFILIDDSENFFPERDEQLVRLMCDRHFGIGSDGLMLIRPHRESDFQMIFFNPDASQSLCGNGSRCAVHFAQRIGLATEKGSFLTTDGIHRYRSIGPERIAVSMHDVRGVQEKSDGLFLNTGSPHLIVSVDDLANLDIDGEGKKYRHDPIFKDSGGTNVNFIKPLGPHEIEVRTYERGVEGETLSCGTGVTAVALSQGVEGDGRTEIKTKGGTLVVTYLKQGEVFSNIWLEGPVRRIYSGIYDPGE